MRAVVAFDAFSPFTSYTSGCKYKGRHESSQKLGIDISYHSVLEDQG